MKKLLLVVPSILALGFSTGAGETPVPPPAEIPGSVQETKATTFAVVIEVLGALPSPAEYAKAQAWAIQMMEARGWVFTVNADQADCLVTVVCEANGMWRLILHLAPGQASAPPDSSPADADDSAPLVAPDAGSTDEGVPECDVDWGDYPYWPIGFFAPAGIFWPHSGGAALRGPGVRAHRRPPTSSPRPLPSERRDFPQAPSRIAPGRASTWENSSSRTAGRNYAPSPSSRSVAASARSSPPPASAPSRR